MKAFLAFLLALSAFPSCGINHANQSIENYLPQVRLVEAPKEERGFYIEWDEPLRASRTITIELRGYQSRGREYQAWAHHGKPIDEIEIYLSPYNRPEYRTFQFQPGSVRVLTRENTNATVTLVRILTNEKALASGHYRKTSTRDSITIVHPTVQNFLIGKPEVFVFDLNEAKQTR